MIRIAVVPSYEPDEYLLLTVNQLIEKNIVVVVVDDGSGSAYRDYFTELPAQVHQVSYPVNKGKGNALKQGFLYIREHFAEESVVVTVDSDGQHEISDVLRILGMAEEFPETLVLGSRRLEKNAPIRSKLGNAITRLVFCLATGDLCMTHKLV